MLPGMIILWAGAVIDIPAGWHLCDGSAGTPDLRNKFVPCAGDTYNPGDNGGADTHDHPFSAGSHFHILPAGDELQEGSDYSKTTQTTAVSGTTGDGDSRPQYYSLAYIMKL